MSASEEHTPPMSRKSDDSDSDPPSTIKRQSQMVEFKSVDIAQIMEKLGCLTISNQVKDPIDGLDIIQVENMEKTRVQAHIRQILRDSGDEEKYTFKLPARTKQCQKYVRELDRVVLLKSYINNKGALKVNLSTRSTTNPQQEEMARRTREVLMILNELIKEKKEISKRGLYYSYASLFDSQENVNTILEDIALMVGCMMCNLPVHAEIKGRVGGDLKFTNRGFVYDCNQREGFNIPHDVLAITDIKSDNARFILVVEKHSIFDRLMQSEFYKTMPCILLSGSGQPDVSTRMMLNKLIDNLNLPSFALVDCDPFGFNIFMTYRFGSMKMSFDSLNLSTPSLKLLGFKPSHVEDYKIMEKEKQSIPKKHFNKMTHVITEEIQTVDIVLAREINMMKEKKEKVEIESLNAFGFSFLEQYIIEQLEKVVSNTIT